MSETSKNKMSGSLKDTNLFWAGTIAIIAISLVLATLLIIGRLRLSFESKSPPHNETTLLVIVAISIPVYLVFLLILFYMRDMHVRISKPKSKSEFNGWYVFGTLLSGTMVIGALIALASGRWGISNTAEVQTGILIVLAVSILTFLLFILTLGFRSLGLADVAQALGLPPGSVRAFIALMLIMIFVILGVYAIRVVGEGVYFYVGHLSKADVEANYSSEMYLTRARGIDDEYDVWRIRELTADGKDLAQQLTTTIATLVVAVAGFYFGTNSVDAARKAVSSSQEQASDNPLIRNIDPQKGETGKSVDVTLKGLNFSTIKSVKLVKEHDTLDASDILTNDTTIRCSFKLDKPASEIKWSVVVGNDEGEKDELEDAFTIVGGGEPPSPSPSEPTGTSPTNAEGDEGEPATPSDVPPQPIETITPPTVESDSDQPGSSANP